MRILIIEDDILLCETLKRILEKEAFAVDISTTGEQGSYLARTNDYDLIILDSILPQKSGLIVCKEIRHYKVTTPILMMSVISELSNKVMLLRDGADDYLTKPFQFEELIARVMALLRRPRNTYPEVVSLGTLSLNLRTKEILKGKRRIYLTRKEFTLFSYLMTNHGSVISKSIILEHVWDNDIDTFSNTVESHISSLRKKIASKKQPYIYTISGRGYKIDIKK